MYIDKPEKEFSSANLFFGILLIKGAVERIAKILFPFPLSTSVSQMIESSMLNSELKSKTTIRYMTDEEVMKFSNGKEKEKPRT